MEKVSDNRYRMAIYPEKVMRLSRKIWKLLMRKTKSPGEAYICLLIVAGCVKKVSNIELEADSKDFIEEAIEFLTKSEKEK